jgi:hypothetical protein
LQGIATVQTDLAARIAAIENGATVKTAPIASQPTADAPKTAQRAARRENAAREEYRPKGAGRHAERHGCAYRTRWLRSARQRQRPEMWANAPAKGKNNKKLPALFANMQPGQSVTLTLDEYARVMPESVTASARQSSRAYCPDYAQSSRLPRQPSRLATRRRPMPVLRRPDACERKV